MELGTELSYFIYFLAILAGVVAGFINTLAGSGSLITLPMLIFLGLPANEANGTNRIGILLQNIVAMRKFHQSGKMDWADGRFLLLPTTLGAIIGAFIATDLNEQWMNYTIAAVMCCMLGVIWFKPERWLREHTELIDSYRGPGNFVLFFIIGLYGGFIQAGVGVFLLIALVARCGFSLIHANALKLGLVLIFTVPAVAIFIYHDQVNWTLGILLALGQAVGAWLAATFATGSASAALWTRRLLIGVILLSIIRLSGIF